MIITLCGSARFEKAFHYWNEVLTLQGHVVFSLAVYPSSKEAGKDWYTKQQKETLDRVHKMKIDASRAIFVVNHEIGSNELYTGESTRSEIDHAVDSHKLIIYASDYGRL